MEPLLVIWGSGIEANRVEASISELGDSSVHKMVMIERQGAVRHSLVPKCRVKTKWIPRDAGTDT